MYVVPSENFKTRIWVLIQKILHLCPAQSCQSRLLGKQSRGEQAEKRRKEKRERERERRERINRPLVLNKKPHAQQTDWVISSSFKKCK